MKRLGLVLSVFISVMAIAQASENSIPIEVERGINKFYKEMDTTQKNYFINRSKEAYIDMMEYVNNSKIPTEEKEGILRNVATMYPNNYIMQKNEAINRVDHVIGLTN